METRLKHRYKSFHSSVLRSCHLANENFFHLKILQLASYGDVMLEHQNCMKQLRKLQEDFCWSREETRRLSSRDEQQTSWSTSNRCWRDVHVPADVDKPFIVCEVFRRNYVHRPSGLRGDKRVEDNNTALVTSLTRVSSYHTMLFWQSAIYRLQQKQNSVFI